MEVVKTIASHGSASHESLALKADGKSYGYKHLVSSASRISLLLSTQDQKIINGTTENNKTLNGARIGVVAKPSAEFVASVLAIWLSGGVAVPLALSYPEAELLHVMTDADVSMILSTEDHSELMQNIAAKTEAAFSLIPDVPSGD
ncbi:malonate--CoA ligase, partial [Tanacetum coccineum]